MSHDPIEQIAALVKLWREEAAEYRRKSTADDLCVIYAAQLEECADEATAALRAQREATAIACPMCGEQVIQKASATLSLALWQHVNWACKREAGRAEAQPVNWEASYHQSCDDADAYKAEAEKRATKLEQNWRSCQHNEGYLRERLAEAQQQIAALTAERDRLKDDIRALSM